MVKTNSKPVSEKELEEESDIEEIVEKDGLNSVNVTPDDTNYDSETYVGKPAEKEEEKTANNKSYIQQRKSYNMTNVDKNKLMNTRVGDHINYFDNGKQDNGIVTKMSSSFLTIVKEDGQIHDVHINDTFFVSDILLNKTWNDMDMGEKTEQLMKVHAYSPRYLSKTWEQLPKELRDVMKEVNDLIKQKEGKLSTIQTGAEKFLKDGKTGGDQSVDASAKDFLKNRPSRVRAGFKQNRALVPKNAEGGIVTSNTTGMVNERHNGKDEDKDKVKAGEYTYSEKPEYKLKGIPEDTGNSWGIKYINKDEEKE
jgi:hypothetical protein